MTLFFSETDPRKSHLLFKVTLGQFCTLIEGESCLPFLLLWNSLSFPQNPGENSTLSQTQASKYCFSPYLVFTQSGSLSPMREAILHMQAAEKCGSHCLWVRRTVLGLRFAQWVLWQHPGWRIWLACKPHHCHYKKVRFQHIKWIFCNYTEYICVYHIFFSQF